MLEKRGTGKALTFHPDTVSLYLHQFYNLLSKEPIYAMYVNTLQCGVAYIKP